MASSTEPAIQKREEEDEDSTPAAEDEDTGAQVAPIVQLREVAVTTGEEDEEILLDLKAKLYRFDGSQWKERGVGTLKLLKHKEGGKVRLVMRQNKTLKICANHLVLPSMTVQEHHGNEKSCVWHAADFADGELKEETFCVRFASIENCKAFKDKIEELTESQTGTGDSEEATTAANLIEKLTVEGKEDTEEKAKGEKVTPSNEEKKDDDTEKPEK